MKQWNWIWNEDWKIAYIYMYMGSKCWMFLIMLLENTNSYITDSRFKRFILFTIMTWFLLIYFKLWKIILKIYADHTSPHNLHRTIANLRCNSSWWITDSLGTRVRWREYVSIFIKVNCRNNVLFGEYLQFCLKPKTCLIRIAA